jgi:hypothetical protein
LILVGVSIIAPKRKRQPPPLPKPKAKAAGSGAVLAAKWVLGGGLSFIGTCFGLWAIWLQTYPTVEAPEASETFDTLPFTITNQSLFFQMYSVSLKCVSTAYGIVIPGLSGTHYFSSKVIVPGGYDIPPQKTDKLECDAPTARNPAVKMPEESYHGTNATLAVSATYQTHIFGWKIPRESDPASYAWQTTPSGKHYWAPFDPNSLPLDKIYSGKS